MKRQLSDTEYWTIARLTYWHLDRSRWGEAEKLARGLLALCPRDGLGWLYYAEARRHQRDMAEACRAYGEAAKALGDRADVWVRLAMALIHLQRFDEAGRALELARSHCTSEGLGRRIRGIESALRRR